MKALRFENNVLSLSDVAKSNLAGEAVVRVLMSGICNTDVEIVRGYAGFEGTIGHEFVGVVESAADAKHLVGKRVIGEINAGCGRCDKCEGNDSRHCPNRTVLGITNRDGAHAEFLNLPSRNLLVVPDEVSDEQAVFAEPLAAAYGITEQVDIENDTKVAVIGDGKLGILCAKCLALKSDKTVLIGKHQEKIGLVGSLNIEGLLLKDALKRNREFDVVVEASGSESGFDLAMNLLKPRGKLVLKSTFQGKANVEMWRVVVDEINIIGSRCGMFSPALELLVSNKVDVSNLISEEFKLTDGINAMAKAAQKGALKVLLKNA
jgi:threonine dehydrogenase-like Zn-dependent dehydrogenase